MLQTRKVTLRRNRPTKVMCVELSGNANSMVQVTKMMTSWEWDVSPHNKASGSTSQLWWTLAQQKTSYLQASAIMSNSVQLAGLMRHWISCSRRRENPQSRSEEVQGSNERRACGGNHMASSGREETAHVSGQDGRSREPFSPRQQGSQDSQTQGRCHSSAEGRERVRCRSLGQERCNQQEAGFSPAGLSPEVCPTDDGQTIRPVRNEGAARERNVVGFDLG